MPVRHYPDWESFDFAGPAADGPDATGPVAFGGDLSPASVLGAYRRGVVPLPAADEHLRTINEFRYEDLVADGTIALVGSWHGDPYRVAWWSPDPRPVIEVGRVHLGRNVRKQLRREDMRTTADTAFGRVAEECRTGREPRWLTDTLLRTLAELHADGWAHSVEVWLDGCLIGRVISGDSLFGRYQGAARVAVADMAARLDLAGGLLIDAQWDSPFLRSLGAVPVPRERYLPLLSGPAERIALPSGELPARRLLGLEGADDLGQRGQRALAGDQVGQAEARAAGDQVVPDLGRAADEHRRHLPHGLRVNTGPAAPPDQLLGAGAPGVRDDERPEGVDLQAGEPVAGRLAERGELGVERRRQPVSGIVVVLRVLDRRGKHPHDVRMTGGQAQHAGSARAHQQARGTARRREHVEVQSLHPVPGAGLVHLGTGEQGPDDAQRLLEPADALTRRVEPDPGGVVFGLVPACAEAELEPSSGHQVQAGGLVRDDRRMAEVVGQHDRAHPQAGGHGGRGGQGGERRQLLAERARREVIPDQ